MSSMLYMYTTLTPCILTTLGAASPVYDCQLINNSNIQRILTTPTTYIHDIIITQTTLRAGTNNLEHTAVCNLPIRKPAIRLNTTMFKLCKVYRHVHWQRRLISDFLPAHINLNTSTSTCTHHVLYNQSHTEGA